MRSPPSQLFPERVTSASRRVPALAPAGHRRTAANRVFGFRRNDRNLLCRSAVFLAGRGAVQAPLHFVGSTRWCRPLLRDEVLKFCRRRRDRFFADLIERRIELRFLPRRFFVLFLTARGHDRRFC